MNFCAVPRKNAAAKNADIAARSSVPVKDSMSLPSGSIKSTNVRMRMIRVEKPLSLKLYVLLVEYLGEEYEGLFYRISDEADYIGETNDKEGKYFSLDN